MYPATLLRLIDPQGAKWLVASYGFKSNTLMPRYKVKKKGNRSFVVVVLEAPVRNTVSPSMNDVNAQRVNSLEQHLLPRIATIRVVTESPSGGGALSLKLLNSNRDESRRLPEKNLNCFNDSY